jgi:hypothetical protein
MYTRTPPHAYLRLPMPTYASPCLLTPPHAYLRLPMPTYASPCLLTLLYYSMENLMFLKAAAFRNIIYMHMQCPTLAVHTKHM